MAASACAWRASPAKIKFIVSDTGPGNRAGERPGSSFEEFTQATPREAGGSGLGLAISRRLAERMGGGLELEIDGAAWLDVRVDAAAARRGECRYACRRSVSNGASSSSRHRPSRAPYLIEKLSELGARSDARCKLESRPRRALKSARAKGARPRLRDVDCRLGDSATLALGRRGQDAGIPQRLVLFTAAERRAFGQKSLAAFEGWLVKPLRLRSLLARFGLRSSPLLRPSRPSAPPIDLSGRQNSAGGGQ